MTPAATVALAARRISQAPAPVALLDACALLDVLRVALLRDKPPPSTVVADARRFTNAAHCEPPQVWLIITETARHEISEHLNGVERETLADLTKLDGHVSRVLDALDLFFPNTRLFWNLPGQHLPQLATELRKLVEDVVSASVVLADDDATCIECARIRSTIKHPPAHKKESRKDCEMFEHYLALLRAIRRSGCTSRAVFVTSKSVDFDHAVIRDELQHVGAEMVATLTHAHGLLGRP